MSMKYVMIYNDWPERTRRLSAADKGRLVDALMAYARGEDPEPLLQGNEQFLFDDLRLQYDRDREQYERKCQQRVIAAEARWNAAPGEKESNTVVPAEPREAETGASASTAAAHEGKAAPAPCKQRAVPSPPDVSRTETDAVDAVAYPRNADNAVAFRRIQEKEKEKEKDKYKYKEKDKYTTTPSTIVPRPVKNEEEEWEHHSSLLDKLRNGTREGAIPSAETQRRGSDNIRAEETGIFADDPHDKENSTVADVAEEKAEDAARGERNTEEPVCAERIAGKAEDAIRWERAAEKAEDAVRMETFAGPADSSSPSAAVPQRVKEEEHCSSLLDKLRNGSQESATTIAEQQGREGDGIRAERTAEKAKENGSSSPSVVVPRPVKNEEEEREHHSSLLDKLRNSTWERAITSAETQWREGDGINAEETGIFANDPHDKENSTVADVAEEKAEDAARGERNTEEPVCAERIAGKAEDAICWERAAEKAEDAIRGETLARPSDPSSPSSAVPHWIKEEEHHSSLLDKLRNGTREGAITSADRQWREGDGINEEETGIFADDPHDKENSTVADVAEEKAEDAARGERNTEEPVCAERIAGKAEDAIRWERAAEKAEDAIRGETLARPADSSSPSVAVPQRVKEEEHCSSLLDKLRNGSQESATTIAEQQGREGDAIQAERTAEKAKEAAKHSAPAHPPLPPVFHDDLIDSIKAMDAPRGENIAKPTYSVSPSPSSAVPHWVKEEQELKEHETYPLGHGTEKAGPAEAAKHSSQAHPPLPPVFHDDLIDSIKTMDAPRGENIAKPTYSVSPSPSSAVPHWVKEEQELKEHETYPFGHGTEKFGPAEAVKHSSQAHPPLPPVFHDDLIASIKAMGQEKPAPDDKPEEKSAENRGGTVSASTAGERHTALTAGHEGKTTPATAHERQITPATNHDGYVDSAASYEEKTAPAMAHEGKTASAVGHEWHASVVANHEEKASTAAAHEGKTAPGEGHEGQAAPAASNEEHPSTTTSHEERTAFEAGHEWHAATPANHKENAVSTTEHEEKISAAADHEGKTAPVAAHEGKSSISDHEEQAVPDAEREGKAPIAADHEEHTSANTAHEGKAPTAADQEEKPASASIPSSFEAWLALSEIALPQDEPPADGSSPGGAGLRANEASVSSDSCGLTGNSAGPAGGSTSALPRNFEELCRAANLPCEAEHQRMAEALARQYSADWLADAMLLAGFERRTANWRYVAGVLRNAKQRGYVSLNLPNRDPAPASYRDASSPFRGPYDPPQPAGYDPGREYGSRRDHDDEEISRVLNRVWRMAMEEAEKEKEGAKARDGG